MVPVNFFDVTILSYFTCFILYIYCVITSSDQIEHITAANRKL